MNLILERTNEGLKLIRPGSTRPEVLDYSIVSETWGAELQLNLEFS